MMDFQGFLVFPGMDGKSLMYSQELCASISHLIPVLDVTSTGNRFQIRVSFDLVQPGRGSSAWLRRVPSG